MEKVVSVTKFLSLFLAIFMMLNIFSIYYFNLPLSPIVITGLATGTGQVNLYVEGNPKVITIYSPENTTYNFSIGAPYLVYLNTSADFFVDNWTYSLYDARHGLDIENDTTFTPNQTITAVRWSNRVIVKAHETDASWITSSPVYFSISVPNSAPIIGTINSSIYVCEGNSTNYPFNVTDADEDNADELITNLDPFSSIFGIFFNSQINDNITQYKIASGMLDDNEVGTYPFNLSVNDGQYLDSESVTIEVIEINNVPSMENLGAQTLWANSNVSTFYHQMDVTDDEDGSSSSGNMKFNLSWSPQVNLFGVNISTGVMNYTPVNWTGNATYSLTVCVNDTALSSPHANISSQCGSSGGVNIVCDDFTLTITDDNRIPVIDSYTPTNTNFSVSSTASTTFGVMVSDDDGTIPDIDWYVNGVLKEENELKSIDNYTYSFGCGVSGSHNVSVNVSDGLASATQNWNVSVSAVACSTSDSGGGGGGGSGSLGGLCNELWVCKDWDVCQNVKRSFDLLSLSLEDYFEAKDLCLQNKFDDRFCGFQITNCFDLASCNNSISRVPKPVESRICYFTENPSCRDGITNCHDNSCELLVDCSGPCNACSTCSDGIQNQGEANIDCGGPCPYLCEFENPISSVSFVIVLLSILVLIILIFIFYKIIKIIINWKSKKRKS